MTESDSSNEKSGGEGDEEIELIDVDELIAGGELGGAAESSNAGTDWESLSDELDDTFDARSLPPLPAGLARPLRGHAKAVLSLAASDKGARLCTGSQDDSLVVWSVAAGEEVHRHRFAESVSLVEYSFDGTLLFAATLDGAVHVLGDSGRTPRHCFREFEGEVTVK